MNVMKGQDDSTWGDYADWCESDENGTICAGYCEEYGDWMVVYDDEGWFAWPGTEETTEWWCMGYNDDEEYYCGEGWDDLAMIFGDCVEDEEGWFCDGYEDGTYWYCTGDDEEYYCDDSGEDYGLAKADDDDEEDWEDWEEWWEGDDLKK